MGKLDLCRNNGFRVRNLTEINHETFPTKEYHGTRLSENIPT